MRKKNLFKESNFKDINIDLDLQYVVSGTQLKLISLPSYKNSIYCICSALAY
jgi:hypothetical protein